MYICIGIFVYMHVRVRIRACAFTMYMCNKRTNSESQIPSNPLEIPPPNFTHYYARQKKTPRGVQVWLHVNRGAPTSWLGRGGICALISRCV